MLEEISRVQPAQTLAARLSKKVTSNGVVVLENWYDASSRRISKTELVNGQPQKWLYLSDGRTIIGVMNENGQLRETFTRGAGLAGDIGTLVAVTHHTGSGVTAGTYYAHHNHRGDIVATRSGTSTAGTYEYRAFGALKSQAGAAVCRFQFSSKERDASTGLNCCGYQFYAPQWQRWPNRDPINELGFRKLSRVRFGSEKAEPNLHAFVRNRPVNRVDTLGLRDWGLLGGKCCNNSSGPEWALVGDGTWKKLRPGECTGAFEDCDGMTCGGGFYQVKNLEQGDCNTPRKDSPKCRERRWTPSGGGPHSKSPTYRGSKEGDTPPEHPYDER